MAGRFQWTTAVTSASGGNAITTTKTVVGGYGGCMIAATTGDFRLTDSLGGTVKVRFNMIGDSSDGTSIGGTQWINLAHPAVFDKGLTISIGDSGDDATIVGQVLYKRVE